MQRSLELQEAVSLRPYSGMATPAVARYLVVVRNKQQLAAALRFAAHEQLPWIVIGAGSNTVFVTDYPGLVVVNQLLGVTIEDESEVGICLQVAAGESWHQLVADCVHNGWFGLENLALIPGSVGAAPMQNIGAYGVEVNSCIRTVTYFDTQTNNYVTLNNQQCEFGYRDSIFKHALATRAVVTEVSLELSKVAAVNLSYAALADELRDLQPQPVDVYQAVCKLRQKKLPLPTEIPNCGSFFKNPVVDPQRFAQIKNAYPKVVSFPAAAGYKLAAGWLIEQAGWKDKSLDRVRVHQDQALVIINPDGASGAEVVAYAAAIQADIKDKFGVQLEVEPNLISL